MKKLLIFVLLLVLVAPLATAQGQAKKLKAGTIEYDLGQAEELAQVSQILVSDFVANLHKMIQETELKKAVLPSGVEDTDAIDAILPFITGVEQDYYVLAGKDAQAARFVGNLLYTAKFYVKGGVFTIPEFIVKYRSYIETRTNLDAFYNDIFKDAQACKEE